MSIVAATAMSPSAARDLTERIRTTIDRAWDLIAKAYTDRAWAVLGYPSWDVYCEREFGSAWFKLPRETRGEVVQSLRDLGLSTRAIGSAIGVDDRTVRRDLSGAASAAPAAVMGTDGKTYASTQSVRPHLAVVPDLPTTEDHPESAPLPHGGTASGPPLTPSLLISGDGYSVVHNAPQIDGVEAREVSHAFCPCGSQAVLYDTATQEDRDRFREFDEVHRYCTELAEPVAAEPVTEPAPTPPRRKPLTDSFDDAATAVVKAVKRVEALAADDRFDKNADQLALRKSDLVRARDALQRVIEKFPS
ncbi:Uncharacterised protein [Mycobacteroides abscessus subsp. abscessus]|uniref:hypothetical protein n=1 Tax=Mycobacteroides abscessus TaxID=36809 RepID=UPI0009A88A06|nr:hypothetical protein [Mycobacteroides abscessus]SLJ41121.1 Uncharacterised protein [Mycobacteroides abscessus subsp. abscessus]